MKAKHPQQKNDVQHQQGNPGAMQQPGQTIKGTTCDSPQNPLNESPKNRIKSYQQLGELDADLAENKDDDIPAGNKPAQQNEQS
ncbi:hypothetical protein I2I11_01960 [Pontibacter sp. 172403-2]|uniref:hypothetical protein n=1 Tax=Pontibacter rufus TaxID=2791028 RepID=UPI0018AF7268|nr:hypothetical protein [Pontibacter sp. 172403-2]MBF9252048.1 hypothetical protein [Pontibacter sp. 172403-2]